jgi:hypothetical protein
MPAYPLPVSSMKSEEVKRMLIQQEKLLPMVAKAKGA